MLVECYKKKNFFETKMGQLGAGGKPSTWLPPGETRRADFFAACFSPLYKSSNSWISSIAQWFHPFPHANSMQ